MTAQPQDWHGQRAPKEGTFNPARKTGAVSPNAHGSTKVGKTRDTHKSSANGPCRVAAISQSSVKGAAGHGK